MSLLENARPKKNQQVSIDLGIDNHDLKYSTIYCRGFNKCFPIFVRLGTTRKITTKSTESQQILMNNVQVHYNTCA